VTTAERAKDAAERLRTTAKALQVQGLRGVRDALSTALIALDHDAPAMETRELDIPIAGGSLPARLYRPAAAEPRGPALVYFHGGGFVVCSLATHDALCRRLARASGMPVISVGYRLAPESPFPGQLDDGEAAVRCVAQQADELQIDPARLLVGGDSAGGYIAVAVAAKLNAERADSIAGQVLFYPLLQLDDATWASSVFADSRIVGRVVVRYIRQQLAAGDLAIPSLTEMELTHLPPTLLAVGGPLDPTRPDGVRFTARLRAAGKPVTLLEYAALPHAFASLTHISPIARRAVEAMGEAAAAMVAAAP
jgi:acetyl esterase